MRFGNRFPFHFKAELKQATLMVAASLLFTPPSEARYIATPESACSPVDFRRTFPLLMRNQNEIAWCYAHAAADYLQFTYRLPEQISAADIAIRYSRSRWSQFITMMRNTFNPRVKQEPAQTGLIKYAVQLTLPQGYCPESSLPSDEWNKVYASGKSEPTEILKATLQLFDLHKKVQQQKMVRPQDLPWYFSFKNLPNASDFFELLKQSSKKNLLMNLRDRACSPDRRPFPEGNVTSTMRFRGPSVFKRIHKVFDESKTPVTIDFFSDILQNYDQPRRKINNLHTTLLYGRKYNSESQQCEYLIKDSYGENCEKYDPNIKCESGYLWMPENRLFKQLTSFYTFKRH